MLLVHGAIDRETPPAHSERVYRALKGPKLLLLLPKSGHAVALDEATWQVTAGRETWVAIRRNRLSCSLDRILLSTEPDAGVRVVSLVQVKRRRSTVNSLPPAYPCACSRRLLVSSQFS